MSDPAADGAMPLPNLPARPSGGHKGDFGSVLVIGGCATLPVRMIGAPALSAIAALRAGAGLVKLACPEPIIDAVMAHCASATGLAMPTQASGALIPHEAARIIDEALDSVHAVVLGPGLGGGDEVETLVLRVLGQDRLPVIVDADALNALSRIPSVWESVRSPCVLTPHPGEFARLAEALKISQDPTDREQRLIAAEALAQRTGTVVVLKGAYTVVSDGHRGWESDAACPVLATGGTGDVLAGLISGLVGRLVPRVRPEIAALPEAVRARIPLDAGRPLDLFDAARIGVDVHAACARQWSVDHGAEGGMLAGELAELIPAELARRERD